VVLGLALLAAGGLAGWAIAWDEPPSPLAPATAVGAVALTWQDYDARTVTLALTPGLQAPEAVGGQPGPRLNRLFGPG
jgi:hypothetical protein